MDQSFVNDLNQNVGQSIDQSMDLSFNNDLNRSFDDTDYVELKNKLSSIEHVDFKSDIFDVIGNYSKEAAIVYPLTVLCEFVESLVTSPESSMYNSPHIPENEKREWMKEVGAFEVPKTLVDDFINVYNMTCGDDYKMTSDEFNMIVVEQTENLFDYVFSILARCSLHKFELDNIYNCVWMIQPHYKKYIITLA
jgi:hypothetical protein